ncbi:MAG TPA: MFS transporter [Kofleriaceae bacterium]|nr:MFS transporter [Kofleriaceae bacterium]
MSRTRTEVQLAFWSALTFGSLLTSFMTTRPVRDALVLDGDPAKIPWLFTVNFLIFVFIAPLWGSVVRKSPRRVVPASFHVFAVGSLVFALLVEWKVGARVTPYVFYIWAAVYNQFVVSVFWSLLADLVGPTTARTLYGPISAGGTIGAFCGPLLTKYLLDVIGFLGVMTLPVLFLELAVVGAWQIQRIARNLDVNAIEAASAGQRAREDEPLGENAWAGVTRMAKSPYLSALGTFTCLTAIAATVVYIAQAKLVQIELPDRHARTDYFATLDFWQQSATFVVQLLVAPFLLRRFGPAPVLCLLPLLQFAGVVGFWLAPSLPLIAAIHISSRTVSLGLTRPARELCFTVLPRDDKYRAKNVIDTLMYRFGDFLSSWMSLALGFSVGLVALSVPLTIGWVALAVVIGLGFRRRTKESLA